MAHDKTEISTDGRKKGTLLEKMDTKSLDTQKLIGATLCKHSTSTRERRRCITNWPIVYDVAVPAWEFLMVWCASGAWTAPKSADGFRRERQLTVDLQMNNCSLHSRHVTRPSLFNSSAPSHIYRCIRIQSIVALRLLTVAMKKTSSIALQQRIQIRELRGQPLLRLLGSLFTYMSPSSIIWYRPMSGDALQLGR